MASRISDHDSSPHRSSTLVSLIGPTYFPLVALPVSFAIAPPRRCSTWRRQSPKICGGCEHAARKVILEPNLKMPGRRSCVFDRVTLHFMSYSVSRASVAEIVLFMFYNSRAQRPALLQQNVLLMVNVLSWPVQHFYL